MISSSKQTRRFARAGRILRSWSNYADCQAPLEQAQGDVSCTLAQRQDTSNYSTAKQSGTKRKASCLEDADEEPIAKQPRTLPENRLPAPLQLAKRSFASIGQAVSNASSQLLQPLLAFASAPHMAVLPWRSAESEPASGSQEAEPDRPCSAQSAHAPVASDQASETLEADRRCAQPGRASVALHHASELLEAGRGRGTAPQQTPVCMQRPSQALVEEMLESPITVSKPLPQPEGGCCFRRQSNLGMQGLITDSAAQNSSNIDCRARPDRQDDCSSVQAQPDGQFVEPAVVDARAFRNVDHKDETMPGVNTLIAVCMTDRVLAVGPPDARNSNQYSITASRYNQMGPQAVQADALEASHQGHATDESDASSVIDPCTAATEEQAASHAAAAAREYQSQPQQQCAARLDLGGNTDAQHPPQAGASCGGLDHLNALNIGPNDKGLEASSVPARSSQDVSASPLLSAIAKQRRRVSFSLPEGAGCEDKARTPRRTGLGSPARRRLGPSRSPYFRCSPSKTVSRFGSSQRSGMMSHAWLQPDKHKGQHTPQKGKSSLSSTQQSPHSAVSLSPHDNMQQTATDVQQEQQAHGASKSSLSGTQQSGSTTTSEATAPELKEQACCTTSLQQCKAGGSEDYLDIPRRVSCERMGSAYRSKHFVVQEQVLKYKHQDKMLCRAMLMQLVCPPFLNDCKPGLQRLLLQGSCGIIKLRSISALEMCKIDGLQQDCREAFLNEKLARKWKGGEAWAQLDLAGLHFTHDKCTQFLDDWKAAAERFISKRGYAAAEKLRGSLQMEWQQLKAIRMRSCTASQAGALDQDSLLPRTPKSIMKRSSSSSMSKPSQIVRQQAACGAAAARQLMCS